MRKKKILKIVIVVFIVLVLGLVGYFLRQNITNFYEDLFYPEEPFLTCAECVSSPGEPYGQKLREKYFLENQTKQILTNILKKEEIKLTDSTSSLVICKEGEMVPFYKSLVEIMEESLGVKFEYKEVQSIYTMPNLENGACDLSFGWTKKESRLDYANFTKPVYLGESIAVSKKSDETLLNGL